MGEEIKSKSRWYIQAKEWIKFTITAASIIWIVSLNIHVLSILVPRPVLRRIVPCRLFCYIIVSNVTYNDLVQNREFNKSHYEHYRSNYYQYRWCYSSYWWCYPSWLTKQQWDTDVMKFKLLFLLWCFDA